MNNKLYGAFLLAVAVLHCVLGDYELEVLLHEYNNPTSRCEGCGRDMVNGTERMRCCDHNGIVDVCFGGDRCDNFFVHCFRALGSDGPCISNEFNSSFFINNDSIQFPSGESSINVTMAGAWEGVQFFTAVMDADGFSAIVSYQPIDNFTIDLNTSFLIPGAGLTERTIYNGTFNLGYLELSFRVSCAANFFGSDCATECVPPNNRMTCDEDGTLVCLSGFTGANCMTNIDDCSNNNACGPNGQCVDGIGTFTCQCDSGFTGERCETGIGECQDIDCSGNGQCIDELASFSCDCNAGFTGERCETDIDDCASANCSENGRCVDGINSFTCVCSAGFTGTFCENQLPPEADSPGNTNAIIGGVVGAVIGSIALVLILALVLVIVMRKSQQTGSDTKVEKMATPEQRPSKHAEAATEAEIPLSQNPVYGLGKMKMQRNQVYELTKTTPAETGSREYDYVVM